MSAVPHQLAGTGGGMINMTRALGSGPAPSRHDA